MCTGFQPKLLLSQLCYQLDPNSLKLSPQSGKGIGHSLMLILDINKERSSDILKDDDHMNEGNSLDLSLVPRSGQSKVYIHKLSPYEGFGAGNYKLSVLKQTTGSKDFYKLTDEQKKCQPEVREECEAREWLASLETQCLCRPAVITSLNLTVRTPPHQPHQDLPLCNPNGTSCAMALPAASNCDVSCSGFYGDVTHDLVEEGHVKDADRLEELKMEYDTWKSTLAKNLAYHSKSPKFCK